MKPLLFCLMICLVAGSLFAGPSAKDILQIGPDTYLITSSSVFNGTSKKDAIVRIANEFAKSKGKMAVSVSLKETRPAVGMGGQFEYQFKLVDSLSDETKKGVGAEIKKTTSKVQQMYEDLVRLNELKEKKIITDAEFEVQKARLLESTNPGKPDESPKIN